MRTWKFSVNGLPYEVNALKLHTALHRIGEEMEKKGYNYRSKVSISMNIARK